VSPPNQIQLSASGRGITDYFFCFVCDEYVWDCDHLIDDRAAAPRVPAFEGSALQSFAYDGKSRTLEIEFRVNAPFGHGEVPQTVRTVCRIPRVWKFNEPRNVRRFEFDAYGNHL
jgi:hypothetical protein